MSITTIKQRFRTLDSALTRIEELEAGAGDITQLRSQIAAQAAEIKALKVAAAGQQSAPATSQPPAGKTIDQMSLRELAGRSDEAAQAGDQAEANRFYRAYSERRTANK
jgi:hypothetical protein